jgi:HNH endonuclease
MFNRRFPRQAGPFRPVKRMRHRRQSSLPVDFEPVEPIIMIGPSVFRPGQTPKRFQPDPRVTAKWKRVRKIALRRDHSTCTRCGQPAADVDHKIELIDGGEPFELDNLQALCAACHDAKSSESRYRRALRATSSWGRMALCPRCAGTGRCPTCITTLHTCGVCLGVRFVPESCAEQGGVPGQSVVAEVSSLAWAGAEPRAV